MPMPDSIIEAAQLATEVAQKRVEDHRLLGIPASMLTLRELLAHAWLCGALDVLKAQSEAADG